MRHIKKELISSDRRNMLRANWTDNSTGTGILAVGLKGGSTFVLLPVYGERSYGDDVVVNI